MPQPEFPRCAEDLSCEWLSEILCKSEITENPTVTNYSLSQVGEQGQSSDVVRIHLEYDEKAGKGPASLIGKFPARFDEIRQLAVGMITYLREVRFFKDVAHTAKDIAPYCFAAEIDLENHDFVLILEDVEHLRLGDWFDSSPEDSRLMLNKLAPFHARWWNHPDLDKIDWIPQPGKPSFGPWIDQLKQVFSAVLPLVKAQYESYMTPTAWATLEKWLENWDELFSYTPGPLTLCHGDFHYMQCFFPTPSDDRLCVIDWQLLCMNSAAMDVARPLLMEPESRRAHENELVESYYNILIENGVKDYSLEDLWEDVRLCSGWTSFVYIIAILQTDNKIFKAYAAERGQDPYEALLSWPGSGLDDWEVSKALDRYLERVRTEKVE